MRRSTVVAGSVLAVLAGASGLGYYKLSSHRDVPAEQAGFEPAEAVQVATVEAVRWQPTADLVGTVVSLRSVQVRNELAGRVSEVRFESGAVVEEGHALLTLDDSIERAELEQARARVRVAEANVEVADVRIRLAEQELARITDAAAAQAAAALELDRRRSEWEREKADRTRLVGEIDEARAHVARMEATIQKMTIRAPFRARAGLRHVHEGQYLAEGSDVVRLEEVTDRIYLDFAVPQEYAPRVKPGTSVMATGELLGPDPVRIEVVAADAAVNNETRNLRVRAVVDNTRGTLLPGMFVQVRVPIEEPRLRLVVPSMAVRRAAYGDSVFVIEDDETGAARARQRFVTLGATIAEGVIVQEGLREGERVAASGSFKLRDGVRVGAAAPGAAAAAGP